MFKTVNLEMSLKVFKQTDDAYIRKVCREVFENWRPLLKNRDTVSVMLWTADGSEILEYTGKLDDTFEWCCYLGTANREFLERGEDPATSLHRKKQLYMENPPVMTYGILQKIVKTIKEEGRRAYPSARIRVGETFDIGPEFAPSDFKYHRHAEIAPGHRLDNFGFVDATALLVGDSHAYAAYPAGIPDKTPFGTFLGKQSKCFLKDMGFDYLWLSNGLGFGTDPWDTVGQIYDGETFHEEKLGATAKKVFEFWKFFREACPDIPIETRGTNNSVGIDYATEGVDTYKIYNAGFGITAPPNSPWAALNDNFGLELMGHMTRICELPSEGFLYRFYLHDPWWVNSPWYDRYNESPHDIYLPMAISRIDREGGVESASALNILSIDNSYGDMPENCINEVIPHLLKAEKNAADRPSPLVWVYPMREYCASRKASELREMFLGDRFVEAAINHGFPLNCVVSTDNFVRHDPSLYVSSILVSPVPQEAAVRERLEAFRAKGGRVLYYGTQESLASLPDDAAKVDVASSPEALREALEQFGYQIRFVCRPACQKSATLTVSSVKNGYWFSVYNPDTTTESLLKFPLGAPVLIGGEAELCDGFAKYHFGRCEHRECRIFVKQQSGAVSAKEIAPVNNKYRRRILIAGLEDATVCLFPEEYCKKNAAVAIGRDPDVTPTLDGRWECVTDENGTYYRAEHVSGEYSLLMPKKE